MKQFKLLMMFFTIMFALGFSDLLRANDRTGNFSKEEERQMQRISSFDDLIAFLKNPSFEKAFYRSFSQSLLQKNIKEGVLTFDEVEKQEFINRAIAFMKTIDIYTLMRREMPKVCIAYGMSESDVIKKVNALDQKFVMSFLYDTCLLMGKEPEIVEKAETFNREYLAWYLNRHSKIKTTLPDNKAIADANVIDEIMNLTYNKFPEEKFAEMFARKMLQRDLSQMDVDFDETEKQEYIKRMKTTLLRWGVYAGIRRAIPKYCAKNGITEQELLRMLKQNKDNFAVKFSSALGRIWGADPNLQKSIERFYKEFSEWFDARHPENVD